MGLGWILGLFGGVSVLGFGAAALFMPPEMFANVLTALKSALGVFSGWPLKAYLVCAALVATSFYISGQRGWDHGVAWSQHLASQAEVVSKQINRTFHVAEINLVEHLTLKMSLTNNTFATIQKEVHHYVTPQTDRRYPLPCGLVQLHNAAILGVDPTSVTSDACPTPASPAPTTASAFAENEIAWGKAYWQLRNYAKAVLNDDLLVRKRDADLRESLIK